MAQPSPAHAGLHGASGQTAPQETAIHSAELRLSGRMLPLISPARLYVCGITPYDVTHLGHAATFIWSDVAASVLRMAGVDVTTCRNVTDVDDVLTRAADARGRDYDEFALYQEYLFERDMPPCGYTRPLTNHGPATTSSRSSSSPPRCSPADTPTSAKGTSTSAARSWLRGPD